MVVLFCSRVPANSLREEKKNNDFDFSIKLLFRIRNDKMFIRYSGGKMTDLVKSR